MAYIIKTMKHRPELDNDLETFKKPHLILVPKKNASFYVKWLDHLFPM